jgi:hypothetical protein
LYFEIEPVGPAPESVAVLDTEGNRILAGDVRPGVQVHWNLPLRPGKTSVFEVKLDPPDRRVILKRLRWFPRDGSFDQNPDLLEEGLLYEAVRTGAMGATLCDPLTIDYFGRQAPHFLHTNACGDFTLLSRAKWLDLRGYPEFDLYSMNIDSVFCYGAHHAGVREELLGDPMRIYHIEHSSGSGWTPDGESKLFGRLRAGGVSYLPWQEALGWAAQMRRLNCPFIFNGGSWGLGDASLHETDPMATAKADAAPFVGIQ